MPNWCSNSIEISGPPEKIKEFTEYLNKNEGKEWFSFFRPCPDELNTKENVSFHAEPKQELIEKYGHDNWYSWNVENWGCKWNCDAQDWSVNEDQTSVTFWFDSAWSPPTELYKFITEETDFSVEAEYCEEGVGFVGEFIDGSDETYEFETVEDLEFIPEHLVENWNLRENLSQWEEEEEDDEQ